MRFFDAAAVDAALSYPALVDALEAIFRSGAISPPRHHHHVHLEGQPDATLLLMPAWQAKAPGSEAAGQYMGLKAVTVFPGNMDRRLPVIYGTYVLLSAQTGAPLAVMDATRLTAWRTGAASALAARHLARADAARMAMIGAGALAPMLIRAHASVRPITHVRLWNRSRGRAEEVVASLSDTGLDIEITDDLEGAVREADIVSAATLSTEPLIRGAWLKPGAHVDCVGAFRPDMRETDDETLQRARLFVDTRPGAFGEAGDILLAIKSGAIGESAVLGDLYDLARGTVAGRTSAADITMFKSVGASIEDLCAALSVYETP
ncbi:MAG: ornithine cyclodeaminase family protein [Hyphomicrobiaceae bacterium]|nr:ornithine cyclodeaminase family protein [Hyphomicrobiaceae bacterium]